MKEKKEIVSRYYIILKLQRLLVMSVLGISIYFLLVNFAFFTAILSDRLEA